MLYGGGGFQNCARGVKELRVLRKSPPQHNMKTVRKETVWGETVRAEILNWETVCGETVSRETFRGKTVCGRNVRGKTVRGDSVLLQSWLEVEPTFIRMLKFIIFYSSRRK